MAPKLHTWWIYRKNKKVTKKKNKLIIEYKQVKFHLENRNQYKEFLLMEIIKLIGVFTFTAMVAGLFLFGIVSMSTSESKYDNAVVEFMKFLLFISSIFFLMLIIDKASKLEIQHLRLKDFTTFENKVKEIIPEEELRNI